MKESKFEKSACSEKNAPAPFEIECPHCGTEMEIWSDESETVCKGCGELITANT